MHYFVVFSNVYLKIIEGRKIELELSASDANVNILSRAS